MIYELKKRAKRRIETIESKLKEIDNQYGQAAADYNSLNQRVEYYKGMIAAFEDVINIADDIVDEN